MSDERSFSDTYARLNEIADEISNTDISLDEALTLYEEAVSLGLEACDLSEQDIFVDEDADGLDDAGDMTDTATVTNTSDAANIANTNDGGNAGIQKEPEEDGLDSSNAPSDEETPIPYF